MSARETHLTDEEFAAALAGKKLDHLRACAACRAEVAQAGEALTHWTGMSLAAAEAHAARTVHPAAVRAEAARWRPAPAWWAAAAAATVAVLLVGGSRQPGRGQAPAGQAQIAADNEFLSDMNTELGWKADGAVQMPAGSLHAHGSPSE